MQVVALKDKLGVVLSKTQTDDKLIGALRSELAAYGRGKLDSSSNVAHG